MKESLTSIEADITTLALDVIVNAANEMLIMGGGVDGAIRRKAGPEMETDLRRFGRCPTGRAVMTPGYRLPAKFVIHTVAPVYYDSVVSIAENERLLSSCYRAALELADSKNLTSIAFPAIGTGIYGWPPEQAAKIAFSGVTSHLQAGGKQTVTFCCFNADDRVRYQQMIDALGS